MALVAKFTFNPFQENTYLIYDDSKEAIIIDPGCYTQVEKTELSDFITKEGLKPVRLINTHCHIDHVFGNKFVAETYGLALEIHEGELPVLEAVPEVSLKYGIPLPDHSPDPGRFIKEGEEIQFGHTRLKTLFTPGHSPASISFYCQEDAFVIAGDVLFYGSIGRTDLPGGNFETLIQSIRREFFTLDDDVIVYPGHGPKTTVGYEKQNNPFLR
ncbi:MAG: MBL fold metallo-hydrolase [Bacteroidota bacterium]